MSRSRKSQPPAQTEISLGGRAVAAGAVALAAIAVAVWWFGARRPASAPPSAPTAGADALATAGGGPSPGATAGATGEASPAALPGAPVSVQLDGAWVTSDGFAAEGSPTAPVSIVVFSDFQCPNCRQFALEILPWLRQTWLARGFVTVVVRDFAALGEDSVRAAEAAHCAGEQGLYMTYYERLFAAQGVVPGPFEADSLVAAATDLGLDGGRFAECLSSGRYQQLVQESTQFAVAQGFEGTPTYLINGRKVAGAIEQSRWDELFQAFETDFASATAAAP